MSERNALRTDVVIKENGSASGVEVLEPSKVVNLTINDDPLEGELIQVISLVVLCHIVAGEFLELPGCRHG
jgi:hypothetical protein